MSHHIEKSTIEMNNLVLIERAFTLKSLTKRFLNSNFMKTQNLEVQLKMPLYLHDELLELMKLLKLQFETNHILQLIQGSSIDWNEKEEMQPTQSNEV